MCTAELFKSGSPKDPHIPFGLLKNEHFYVVIIVPYIKVKHFCPLLLLDIR